MGKKGIFILKGIAGTPGRIRTCDLLLRRQPLYPSELQAHIVNGRNLPCPGRVTEPQSTPSFVPDFL